MAKQQINIKDELKAIKKHGHRVRRGGGKWEGFDLSKWRPYAVMRSRPGSFGEPRPEHEMQRVVDKLNLRELRYRPASELGIEARHSGISDCDVWLCPREVWDWRQRQRKLELYTERKYSNYRALQKSRSQRGRFALNKQQIEALAAQQE
jgi:hypothetical protein